MSSHPSPGSPPLSPPTLRSLCHNALGQQERIDSFLQSSPGLFKRLDSGSEWVQLWQVAWDKDPDDLDKTHDVERDQDRVDDSLIPDVVPSKCNVTLKPSIVDTCWTGIKCKKIFIRPVEYKEAEESAVSACRHEGIYEAFLVTGQPGIGLSLFHLAIVGFSSFRQGNPCFCFASSSGAWLSSSLPRCKSVPTMSCFSTGEV